MIVFNHNLLPQICVTKAVTLLGTMAIPIMLWHFLMISMLNRILKNLLSKGQHNAQDMAKPSECQMHGMLDYFIVMKLFHSS